VPLPVGGIRIAETCPMQKTTYARLSAAALADVAIFIARRARSIDLYGRVARIRNGSRSLVLSLARRAL
jgi:hypothetical protein